MCDYKPPYASTSNQTNKITHKCKKLQNAKGGSADGPTYCTRDSDSPRSSKICTVDCHRTPADNPVLRQAYRLALDDGCLAGVDQLYLRASLDLKRRERALRDGGMFQALPESGAYNDYFPPGFCPGEDKPIRVPGGVRGTGCAKDPSSDRPSAEEIDNFHALVMHERRLRDGAMVMGPRRYFPEFFPHGYDFVAAERKAHGMHMDSPEKSSCGGDRPPGPFNLNTRCALMDFVALGYVPWWIKQHARIPDYCLPNSLKRRHCSQLIATWK